MKQNIFILVLFTFSIPSLACGVHEEKNKKTVKAFYDMAFNQHKPAEAMEKFVGNTYTQHNPTVADGKQAFIDAFVGFQKDHPKSRADIKRVVADDNLVVLHVWSRSDENDRGHAVVDIFRVEKGKIVEHWDVGQAIPEKAANTNTMF